MPQKRTPTKQLEARGSRYAKGRRETEPELVSGRPVPPEYLSSAAKEHWDKLLPCLEQMGLCSPSWGPTLQVLCEALAEFQEACEKLNSGTEARIYCETAGNGKEVWKEHPWLKRRDVAGDKIIKMSALFGLSPADISRVVSLDKLTPQDPPIDTVKESKEKKNRQILQMSQAVG